MDQDTARYSLFSVEEKRVSLTEPYTTDNLFSSRVFRLNIGYACSKSLESKYDKFLERGCYRRYLLLISPYCRGLRDLTIQCLTVNSMCSLNISRSDTDFFTKQLGYRQTFKGHCIITYLNHPSTKFMINTQNLMCLVVY